MDFLKKNPFIAACAGIALAVSAVVGVLFFTNSPADAEKQYTGLLKQVQTAATKSKGDIAVVEQGDRDRQAALLRTEAEILGRAVRTGEDTAVYVVHWGPARLTAEVDRNVKRVVLVNSTVTDPNRQFYIEGLNPATKPPTAGLVQVDAVGTPENLETWKRNSAGSASFKNAGFILLPKTLHGRTFEDNPAFKEEFMRVYKAWPDKVRESLRGVETDPDLLQKFRDSWYRFRLDLALNIRDLETYALNRARVAARKEPLGKGDVRLDVATPVGPELQPADLVRRFFARLGLVWWQEGCLYQEAWLTGAIQQLPSPARMWSAQNKVWLTEDVVAAINAVNTVAHASDGNDGGPVPTATELKALKIDALKKQWDAALAKYEADAATAATPVTPMPGMGVVKSVLGEMPKALDVPSVFSSLMDELGPSPKAAGKKASNPAFVAFDAKTRQGVLGSDIKMLVGVYHFPLTKVGLDAEWPYLPPAEPIVLGLTKTETPAPPAPAPAGKPGDPKAPPAEAPAEPEFPLDKAQFRLIDRPKVEDVKAARVGLLRDEPPPRPAGPSSKSVSDGKGGTAVSANRLSVVDVRFGTARSSLTGRGSTNDYFVSHVAVRVIATARGIDRLLTEMESRRFYTAGRAPDLAFLSPAQMPDYDFGAEPVYDAVLYFESVQYIQAYRRVYRADQVAGEAAGKTAFIVNLIPDSIWNAYTGRR